MENLPKPHFDEPLVNFYYASQLKNYAVQFMSIFGDMQVSSGKNDYKSASNIIHVPIKYGSMDRVVGAIKANNNQNTMLRVPCMAANLMELNMAPEKYSGQGTTDRYTHLQTGKAFPQDLKVVYRRKHIPYTAVYELAVMTSNKEQQMQIIEQICLLFDPILQFQTGDDAYNTSKITMLELKNITFDETYPSGLERRSILTNFTFETTVYISAPYNVRDNIISKILVRLQTIPTFGDVDKTVNETDNPLPEYSTYFELDDFVIPTQ